MIAFPLVAAIVAVVFAVMLLRQFALRRGIAQLAWGIAMAMYAAASLAVAAGVSGGWDETLYKGYWLFGAMLNVPFLAVGSIALLRKPVLTMASILAAAVATVYGVIVVAGASANTRPFLTHPYDIPHGKDIWHGALVGKLGSGYSIPAYLIVVGIAAFSSLRGKVSPDRARANWLIAAGATIVALGGFSLARLYRGALFSIFLALGIAVMFWGFVLASRPAGAFPAPPAEPPREP